MSPGEPTRYDAFLSYNSLDGPAVRELAERLKNEHVVLYLEAWELAPGREYQPALAEALHRSKSCVVFLGPNGLGPWQKQEVQVAIDKRARDDAFPVIPVLLPGTERPRRGDVAHLDFLINASWVEFLNTLDDERAFQSLVWGITGIKPTEPDGTRHEGICPYRGLEVFRPDDAKFFFGRKNLSGWLVSALRREVRAPQGVRFLGVLGPSGSGKSSVVLAGLVPRLIAGAIEGSEHWPVAILRPGDDPLKNLAIGVVTRFLTPGTLPNIDQARTLINQMRSDSQALDLFAQLVLHDRPADVRLVVVVDQFEEVFTYRPQDGPARAGFEQDRGQFFANLLNAAATPGGRVAVVLTLRSDFFSACAPFPQLSAVLSAHQELVGPMTAAELREAIERPAQLVGCEVGPSLTERLLADVKGQSGALPLLQFALTEVWKKRDVRRLTLDAYNELGKDDQGEIQGINGLLDRRANEIYRGLSPDNQTLCRQLFLRLVQPGEGIEDTKRRVSYRELLPADPTRAEAVRNLIQTLAAPDARLITTEGASATEGTVEVAHEALIRGWKQLRQWVDTERMVLPVLRRLTEDSKVWADAKPEVKADFLYPPARLEMCKEYIDRHRDELSQVETDFLAASEAAERKREEEKRKRERDKLLNERRLRAAAEEAQEAERKRAEDAEASGRRQKQLGHRFRVAAIAAFVLATISSGLGLWAYKASQDAAAAAKSANKSETTAINARKRAEDQATMAESRRLAALSEAERGKHLDRAFLLAIEALRVEALGTERTTESRDSLFRAFAARPGIVAFLHADEGRVTCAAWSSDGKTLAAAYSVGGGVAGSGVVLWDAQKRTRLKAEPLPVAEGRVSNVAFSPDGKTLAAAYFGEAGSGLVLWNVQQQTRLQARPLPVGEGTVLSVAFSPDGKTLAAGSGVVGRASGGVVLWDAQKRERLQAEPLQMAEGGVESVAFSPDGKTLAVGYNPGGSGRSGVVLWDAQKRTRLHAEPLVVTEGSFHCVTFSPDGKTLATGYISGGASSGVVLWDAQKRTRLHAEPLFMAEGGIRSLAFSPDSKTLAAGYSVGVGSLSGGVVLWDAQQRTRLHAEPLTMAEGTVESVAFSPDSKTLAAGYNSGVLGVGSGGVVLWDVQRRTRLQAEPLTVAESASESVAFSPDGKTLAAGYVVGGVFTGGVVLWDAQKHTWLQSERLAVAEGIVKSVAFSADGTSLAAGYNVGYDNGGVVLWDAQKRTRLQADPLPVAEGFVGSVAFNPDNKTLAAGYNILNTGSGGGVVLWDVQSRTRLQAGILPVAEGGVESVAFSPDGKTLAAGYNVRDLFSGGVMIWDAQKHSRLQAVPLPVPEGFVWSVAFSPDGKTLAAGFNVRGVFSGGVVLWDAQKRTRLQAEPLPVTEGFFVSMAFSPDGTTLAVGYGGAGGSGAVLWDAQKRTRQQADPLTLAEGGIRSLAFSPDSKTLAAGYVGAGRGVVLWDVDLKSWKQRAGQIANRNLSLDEWRRYFPDTTYRQTFLGLPAPRYDESYKKIARNLSRTDWRRYYPDEPYRKTFPDLPIPSDAASGETREPTVGAGHFQKKNETATTIPGDLEVQPRRGLGQ